MIQLHASFIKSLLGSVRDLTPVILVIVFFQLVVLEQPFPDVVQLVQGIVLVLLGLTLFIMGLELALFPIGDSLAKSLVSFGSLFWLIVFAFALGFGTTIAEPALIAIADEAAKVAANSGAIALSDVSRQEYATGLRLSVALAVGIAVVLGVVRIIRGWPIHYLIIGGYIMVVILTLFAPQEIIGIAYDSGGVTTSTVTVPLVTALGVGLSHAIKGRSPLYDGFGLIALASLFPMIFVMAYGIIIA